MRMTIQPEARHDIRQAVIALSHPVRGALGISKPGCARQQRCKTRLPVLMERLRTARGGCSPITCCWCGPEKNLLLAHQCR